MLSWVHQKKLLGVDRKPKMSFAVKQPSVYDNKARKKGALCRQCVTVEQSVDGQNAWIGGREETSAGRKASVYSFRLYPAPHWANWAYVLCGKQQMRREVEKAFIKIECKSGKYRAQLLEFKTGMHHAIKGCSGRTVMALKNASTAEVTKRHTF
ncbi:hypothetical protein T4C_6599 [Trichinella pseudospiralis]|uniref:Uncharacterized protein n=2 Tax=Trichinella pseudospiralis TaxID=6337 RepID=A0A0V1HSI0_TRIPS|nr:hypothetical protein T4C_6599 [Trichinella pseudospiralis]